MRALGTTEPEPDIRGITVDADFSIVILLCRSRSDSFSSFLGQCRRRCPWAAIPLKP
jgi:hypothetical protein